MRPIFNQTKSLSIVKQYKGGIGSSKLINYILQDDGKLTEIDCRTFCVKFPTDNAESKIRQMMLNPK